MFITDAHIHVWEAERPDRPWDPHYPPDLAEPFTVGRLLAAMDAGGVDRAVLIPPRLVHHDNSYALEAAAACPDRFGVMGRFDVWAPGLEQRLAAMAAQPGMRGVRFILHDPPDSPRLERFWSASERLGIPVALWCPGRPADVLSIARRHPDLRILVDHIALDAGDVLNDVAGHLHELERLVAQPRVILKISSLPRYSHQRYPFADLHDVIRRLYDAFGPSRLAWGSDYTRVVDRCTYADTRGFLDKTLPNLSNAERAELLSGTISQFLSWHAHQPVVVPS